MPDPLRILFIQSALDSEHLSAALQRNRIEFEAERIDRLTTLQQALEEAEWDLILASHRLPECDLDAVLRLVRESRQPIACLAVTRTISKDRLSRLFHSGMHGHLDIDNLYLLAPMIQHALELASFPHPQNDSPTAQAQGEIRYRNLLDNAPIAILILCSRRIVYLNQAARKTLAIDAETPISRIPLEQLVTTNTPDRLLVPPPERDVFATEASIETRLRRADGNQIPVEVRQSRTDYLGRAATLLVFSEISGRISAESRLQQAAKVFEYTTEGVILTDENANIIAVNPAFSEITGFSEKEVLGRNPRFLQSGRHDKAFYAAMWNSLKQQKTWQGEIWNRRKNGEVYPEWLNITTVQEAPEAEPQYVAVFSDITSIIQSQTQLEHLAHHDPLTDLPNRLLFEDRLEHAIANAKREKTHLAVLFLDLDRFKNINDSLGHAVGDALLVQVAQRLRHLLRHNDTAARMGGDEFTILVENLVDPSYSAVIATKIQNQLKKPFEIFGRKLHITVSIGISLYPEDGRDVGNLTKNADAAMYQAKENGRNNYRFYTSELTQSAFERLLMETELRTAIKEGQLLLYYQPQFSILSGKMTGTEALLRWQHPRMGTIPPAQFVPLAEETGLIHEIGLWSLETVCRQTRSWSDKGLFNGRMAINLSVRQIMMTDLILRFEEIIDKTGCPPRQLQFEVTEGLFMRQKEISIPVLEVFKQLGLSIAIDDFGTGFSSLSYLKQLPIDKLKIDRTFIKDIPDNKDDVAITQAIIALGQNLGLEIIAEGVETEAQQNLLKIMGCQEVQGYLYGRPMPADVFEQKLINGHAHPSGSYLFSA
jgi:diguanylate cyclase (GGDEF)-like protein/PAS domain S-box-containing protein